MRNTAPFLLGGRRIHVLHFAPTDTDKYACQGILIIAGCGWTFWLFARLSRIAPWLGRLGVPRCGAPHDLHCHYKEGTSYCLVAAAVLTFLDDTTPVGMGVGRDPW